MANGTVLLLQFTISLELDALILASLFLLANWSRYAGEVDEFLSFCVFLSVDIYRTGVGRKPYIKFTTHYILESKDSN